MVKTFEREFYHPIFKSDRSVRSGGREVSSGAARGGRGRGGGWAGVRGLVIRRPGGGCIDRRVS